MDIDNILLSVALSSSLYGLAKSAVHIYKNYYLKSTCHEHTLSIEIVTTNPQEEGGQKKEEQKEPAQGV